MSLGFSPSVSCGGFTASQSPLNGPPSIQSVTASRESALTPRGPPLVPGPWHYPTHPMAAAAALLSQSGAGPEGVVATAPGPPGPGGVPPSLLPITGGSSIMENWENWRQFQQAAYANNLDPHMLAFYHNAGCAMDLSNAPRRKNATRETTSMLKAWLNEHRKNPYPTKGEKIMLAIITKMTLTQVSTWFANARRRLKKENKMTWSPRNRSEEERERGRQQHPILGGGVGEEHGERRVDSEEEYDDMMEEDDGPQGGDGHDQDDLDDFDEADRETLRRLQSSVGFFGTGQLNHSAAAAAAMSLVKEEVDIRVGKDCESSTPVICKPKIWSLVDTATKEKVASPTELTNKFSSPMKSPSVSVANRSTTSHNSRAGFPGMNPHFLMASAAGHNSSMSAPLQHPHFSMAGLLPHSPHAGMFGKLFPPPPPPPPPMGHPHHATFCAGGPPANPAEAAAMAAAYLHNPFMYPALSAFVNRPPPAATVAGMTPADIAAAMAAAVAASRDPPRLSPEISPFGIKEFNGQQAHCPRASSPAVSSTSSSPSK